MNPQASFLGIFRDCYLLFQFSPISRPIDRKPCSLEHSFRSHHHRSFCQRFIRPEAGGMPILLGKEIFFSFHPLLHAIDVTIRPPLSSFVPEETYHLHAQVPVVVSLFLPDILILPLDVDTKSSRYVCTERFYVPPQARVRTHKTLSATREHVRLSGRMQLLP